MRVLGLTGSLGMGKSTVARMFALHGVPIYNADDAVANIYRGEGIEVLKAKFPSSVQNGIVNREALRALLKTEADWTRLEQLIHPLVRKREEQFLEAARVKGAQLAVLDIPLLLETGGDQRVDTVMVVSAPFDVQKKRALARPGMSEEKFKAILARQMPDAEKRKRAHIIIDTGCAPQLTARQVEGVVRMFLGR